MKKLCFMFPGQASQYPKMGKDLYETYPEAKRIYDYAEEVLELPIKRLSFEGPEEELKKTYITQPAVLVHSLAVCEILKTYNIKPAVVLGHSLGEYSALYCANVLSLEAVLKLVKKRSALMYNEGLRKPGTMAAILGLEDSVIEELCRQAQSIVVPANYNAPGQLVISGSPEGVAWVCNKAQEKGAIKCVPLQVSGAFHSPLLKESAQEFLNYLNTFEFNPPSCPIIPNRTGEVTESLTQIKQALSEQLINPVLWTKSILSAKAFGAELFLEVGPNRILSGLAKRIDKTIECLTLGTTEEIKNFVGSYSS
ncbi:MAG: ACP S-malonyltransferase [candidate division WOR-3 bacterium]|nr:ACP S-malonyltransferase [candidate division WOR-3 bacterium]MCX7757985.1 ACP S-malonyltransferase [candidate division WOR-3 bacterium]MDW7987209.1 ACP S-malonyltransferase [candidate division WOR-3 bacterium]